MPQVIDSQKMCVDKLMDGSVDNLMDNSSSCPQVAAQAVHELTHDELFNYKNNIFISYLSTVTVLNEGATSYIGLWYAGRSRPTF